MYKRQTYDAVDNIRSWKLAGVKDYADYLYESGTNRLTGIRNTAGATVVSIGYDVQGNLANKDGQAYEFDYGNRLRNVPGKESYRYDGLGRRVQTTKPDGSHTLWQYGQSGQMLFSFDGPANQKTHEFIYLAGSLVATIDHHWPSNTVIATKYQHTDALGSPVAVTNESGAVVERNDYEPWGAIIGNPTRSGIGYTGHVMDGGTGLTYMQQRYYDQSIGRFLSVDPVAASNSNGSNFSRYWYANNNPYKFVDPDGRESACFANGVGCGLRPYTEQDKAKVAVAMAGLTGGVLAFVPDPSDALFAGIIAKLGFSRAPLAYRIAAQGGKHAGFLKQQLTKTMPQLQKTIRSIEKQIETHRDKIRNPEKYMTRDDASVPANVARARADWAGDIKRQQEQRDITKEVLRQATSCAGTKIKGNC